MGVLDFFDRYRLLSAILDSPVKTLVGRKPEKLKQMEKKFEMIILMKPTAL